MKIKCDFVTNSSSTSFILSVSKNIDIPDEIEITIKVNLKRYISEEIKNIDELKHYLSHNYDTIEEYTEYANEIESGNKIVFLECGNETDDPVEAFLLENGINNIKFPDGIKVIQGEGGY